ncbi:3-hydroxyacyl-ACP dehydratase FabZ [Bacillota bacterium]
MTRDELKKILPHREPMLLLDEAEVCESGMATGIYHVKGDEFFLNGHFPGNPVVPGVILCEIMAQTCGVLMSGEVEGKTPYYTGLDKVKFRGAVKPGDRIEFKCEITNKKPPFVFAKGKGYVEGKLCIQGEFSFAII